jgi:2-polyprenyl-3-methyl-5-hydroxy-6-metoxy-1,4-benzoquinol methylase
MKNKELKDIIQWQIHLWKIPLLYWEKSIAWEKFKQPNALEIGAREGGLSLWLAQKNFNVVCSDLQNPENIANPLHKKYNVQDKITYASIDATNILYENHFDIIILKSVLGGIGSNNQSEKQIKTIKEIYKALKPSGYFLFAENAKGSLIHQILRKSRKWNAYWNYPTYDFMKQHISATFKNYEIKGVGFCSSLLPIDHFQKIFVPIDKVLSNIVPLSYQPVLYGFAQK